MRCFAAVAAGLMLVLPLAGCGDRASSNVRETVAAMGASVRTNPNPAAPWAAYFTVKGGAEDRVITGVSVAGAGRAELHESRMTGGMMTMAPLARIPVPAGEDVVFRQGGKHVMLFDVTPEARTAGRMTLTLSFDDGSRLPVELAFARQADVASVPSAPPPGPLVRPNDPRIVGNAAPMAAPSPAPHHSEIEHSEGGNDEHAEHQGH